jgi:hypothetical protein
MDEKPKVRTLWVAVLCFAIFGVVIAGSDGFAGFTRRSTEPGSIAVELLLSILMWSALIGLPTLAVLHFLDFLKLIRLPKPIRRIGDWVIGLVVALSVVGLAWWFISGMPTL